MRSVNGGDVSPVTRQPSPTLGEAVDRLCAVFFDVDRGSVMRQIVDARQSVQWFGLDPDQEGELVERLAREHLDALRATRSGVSSGGRS